MTDILKTEEGKRLLEDSDRSQNKYWKRWGSYLSDRIAIIYRGEFVAILDAHTATIEEIGLLMGGGTRRG